MHEHVAAIGRQSVRQLFEEEPPAPRLQARPRALAPSPPAAVSMHVNPIQVPGR
jgi:hypothetical protein